MSLKSFVLHRKIILFPGLDWDTLQLFKDPQNGRPPFPFEAWPVPLVPACRHENRLICKYIFGAGGGGGANLLLTVSCVDGRNPAPRKFWNDDLSTIANTREGFNHPQYEQTEPHKPWWLSRWPFSFLVFGGSFHLTTKC